MEENKDTTGSQQAETKVTVEEEEVWQIIPGLSEKYEASTLGRIRNKKKKIMNIRKNSISLRTDNGLEEKRLDILILSAFVLNTKNYTNIFHVNFNVKDNRLKNLVWIPSPVDKEFENFLTAYFGSIWKKVKEKPMYHVSKDGRVFSSFYNIILKPAIISGCYIVNMRNKLTFVHKLVADAFLENPKNLPQVNHKSSNKLDNNVENLYWTSQGDNKCQEKTKRGGARRPVIQIDSETDEDLQLYESIAEAARELNIRKGSIQDVVLGKRDIAGGYKWAYMSEKEIFPIPEDGKKIPYAPDDYLVTPGGKIYSIKSQRYIAYLDGNGYEYVIIKGKKYSVHRIVAEAFVKKKNENDTVVNHINEKRNDNRAVNLEYTTDRGNSLHSRGKSVIQYSLDGEKIAEFPGYNFAADQTGVPYSAIVACCDGKRENANGFIWKNG